MIVGDRPLRFEMIRLFTHLGGTAACSPAFFCALRLERKGVGRARVNANAAIDACILVDNADVLNRQCLLRAFVNAHAASYAIVSTNFYCHDRLPLSLTPM